MAQPISRQYLSFLGDVCWYGPWRQYVFHPFPETIFSAGCLDDIAAFVKARMAARREVV